MKSSTANPSDFLPTEAPFLFTMTEELQTTKTFPAKIPDFPNCIRTNPIF